MNTNQLNYALCKALGLPPYTTKAVLTLEPGKMPTLQVECLMLDRKGAIVYDYEKTPEEIKKLQFMLRLEPFRG